MIMTVRKHPVSARLDDDDFDVLMSVNGEGIHTQSDKVRELIRVYRLYHGEGRSLDQAFDAIEDLLSPSRQTLFHHSLEQAEPPILSRVLQWLPGLLAPITASHQEMNPQELERHVRCRLLEILDHFLRCELTPSQLNLGCDDDQTTRLTTLAQLYLELKDKE